MSPAALACTTLLLDGLPSAAALRAALPEATPAQGGPPASAAALWMSGQHAVVVDLAGGVRARVDLLASPWPDGLGVGGPPALAAAVAAGAFGPPPAPGALARAVVHSPGLPAGAAAGHQAVLRLRALPRAGGPPPRVVHAALAGLALRLARALAALSPLLFHPAGELLLDLPAAEGAAALIAGPVPLALIAGLRVLRVGDPAGWAVVDSVGHGLLGVPDLEVAFVPGMSSRMGRRTRAEASPAAVAAFARELGLYLLGRGDVLLDGHFLEGPGSRYRVHRPGGPLLGPDRAVIRLLPVDGPPLPALLDDGWRAPAAGPGPALGPALDDAALRPGPFGAGQGEGLDEDDAPEGDGGDSRPPVAPAPAPASRAPGGRGGGGAGRGAARGPGPGGAAPAANPRAAPGRGAPAPPRRPPAPAPPPAPRPPPRRPPRPGGRPRPVPPRGGAGRRRPRGRPPPPAHRWRALVNATPGTLAPRFPFPLDPIGWFCLGLSAELAPGQLRTQAFMGREVVLFRGEDGVPALMDAYCPHMGAHMGKGGVVCGSALRCPFHHFDFAADGSCVRTAYGHEPPRAARARTWPVCEVNGLLFAWHHPEGQPPSFALPTLPTAGFAGPHSHAWTLRTHPQEITENSVDVGHFGVVHRYFDVTENAPLVVDGPRLFVSYGFGRAVEALGLRLGAIRTEFTGQVHGLGYSTVDSYVKQAGIRSLHLVLPTPTTPGQTELRIVLWVRPDAQLPGPARLLHLLPAGLRAKIIAHFAFAGYKNDVSQDIQIWENKAYVHPPALAKGDGPVGRFRAWCRQFYAAEALPVA